MMSIYEGDANTHVHRFCKNNEYRPEVYAEHNTHTVAVKMASLTAEL